MREKPIGFYKTSEGRDFLQEIYPIYLRRAGIKDGKVATIIADENFVMQLEAIRSLKSALKRWGGKGQRELFRDRERNIRHLKRLEKLMMTDQSIAEVLQDKSASEDKIAIGKSMSMFYMTRNELKNNEEDIKDKNKELSGCFYQYESYVSENNITKIMNLKRIYTFTWINDVFLLAHDFTLDGDVDSAFTIKDIWTGYGIPSLSGGMLRYMICNRKPNLRCRDYLEEIDARATFGTAIALNKNEVSLIRRRSTFFDDDIYENIDNSDKIEDKDIVIIKKLGRIKSMKIEEIVKKMLWNIPI